MYQRDKEAIFSLTIGLLSLAAFAGTCAELWMREPWHAGACAVACLGTYWFFQKTL